MATGGARIGTIRHKLRAPGDQNLKFTHELEESGSMHGGGLAHRALGQAVHDTVPIPDPDLPAALSNRSRDMPGT